MKTALITGTTSGIGKAFVNQFAEKAYTIVLVSANEDKLLKQKREIEKRYAIEVRYIACDLADEKISRKDISSITGMEMGY